MYGVVSSSVPYFDDGSVSFTGRRADACLVSKKFSPSPLIEYNMPTVITPCRSNGVRRVPPYPTTESVTRQYIAPAQVMGHPYHLNARPVTSISHNDEGPVGFTVASLPLPCAYLRLPWQRGRPFARLLPARANETSSHSAIAFRSYIKRMMVEEVCFSPASYLLRYCHSPPPMSREELNSPLRNSRLMPFISCRRAFPAVQALCAMQACHIVDEDQSRHVRLEFLNLDHPNCPDRILFCYCRCPSWDLLPLSYRALEAAWLNEGVNSVMETLNHAPENVGLHLVVGWDASSPVDTWAPHNMRQVVHLIAQTVSILCSCIPLLLHPHASDDVRYRRGSRGFASVQIVVLPCKSFNVGVSAVRETASINKPPKRDGTEKFKPGADSGSEDEHPERPTPYDLPPPAVSPVSQSTRGGGGWCGFGSRAARAVPPRETTSSAGGLTAQFRGEEEF